MAEDGSGHEGDMRRLSGGAKTIPRAGPIAKLKALDPTDIVVKGGNANMKSSSSRFLGAGPQEKLERLPQVKSLAAKDRPAMFLRKIKQCMVVFDFTKALEIGETEQKEIKRETLLELVEFLLTEKLAFTVDMYKAVFDMIEQNLFRPLPPRINPKGPEVEAEDDEPVLEAAWPHVQLVYEFFLRFVESPEFDANVGKNYLTKKFINRMLDLFGSEDPRERDYLKTTLHRVYGKFLSLRSYIRRQIKFVFLTFCYETEHHNGIAELLEILGSIINGFTLPLKPEHREFLTQALIPLHKPRSMSTYHPQLSYCLAQFLEKDPSLTEELFKKIVHYWPIQNSAKQLLFLNEVEELLCVVEPDQFVVIQEMLFRKVAQSISSTHFQIAEKSLTLWNNEYILSLIAENVEVILPIVFPALYYVARTHWNKAIRSMAYTSLRLFMDIDEVVFGHVIEDYRKNREKEMDERESRVERWREVFAIAEPEKLKPRKFVRREGLLQAVKELEESQRDKTDAEMPAGSEAGPVKEPQPQLPPSHVDPLQQDNDGLPASVKIPFHLNQLVVEDFTPSDPVFKELTELHQMQLNKKLRKKQMVPMDQLAVEALQGHTPLDELDSNYTAYASDSDSGSDSGSASGSEDDATSDSGSHDPDADDDGGSAEADDDSDDDHND